MQRELGLRERKKETKKTLNVKLVHVAAGRKLNGRQEIREGGWGEEGRRNIHSSSTRVLQSLLDLGKSVWSRRRSCLGGVDFITAVMQDCQVNKKNLAKTSQSIAQIEGRLCVLVYLLHANVKAAHCSAKEDGRSDCLPRLLPPSPVSPSLPPSLRPSLSSLGLSSIFFFLFFPKAQSEIGSKYAGGRR